VKVEFIRFMQSLPFLKGIVLWGEAPPVDSIDGASGKVVCAYPVIVVVVVMMVMAMMAMVVMVMMMVAAVAVLASVVSTNIILIFPR
jgi:hypothetical protein